MAGIYISKLNSAIKRNILEQKYSVQELMQIKASLETEMKKKQKSYRLVLVMVTCIMLLMLILTYVQMGFSKIFFITLGMTSVIVAFAVFLVWIAGMGLLKLQYNQSIKKAYPDYAEDLCVK